MMTDRTRFTIDLEDETVDLLMDAAADCQCDPRELIESIVHDVLVDDAIENGREVVPPRYLMN